MGSDMFFLLRTAFWLTLVLALIPLGSGQERTSEETVDPVSAFLAAQAAVSDIGGFCQRNPEACETGGDALSAIGSRARDGARIVYEFLDTQVTEGEDNGQLVTGSTASQAAGQKIAGHQQTVPVEQYPWQPDLTGAPRIESVFGPVPRPKPVSGSNT